MKIIARVLAVLLIVASAPAQEVIAARFRSSVPGTGTFTVVQHPTHASFSGASSVAIPLTSTTVAGNLYVITGQVGSTGAGTSAVPISVSSGGTLINAPSCGSPGLTVLAYVLPSTSTAVSTSITVNFNASTTGFVNFYELHPSANGSLSGLDNCQAIASASSSASQLGPAFTWGGTNDAEVQFIETFSNVTPTAISLSYGNTEFISFFGWAAHATPASSAAPTWTLSGASQTQGVAGAFGFNVPASVHGSLNDFEAGTLGSAPAVADLNSSMHGAKGCQWAAGPVLMLYASAASMPLLNATGRFYGDGVSYPAGTGSKGLQVTWDGVDNSDSLKCQFTTSGVAGNLRTVTESFKYNDNFPANDTSSVDCGNIHGATEFAGGNCYGDSATRFFRIETPGGNGTNINASGGTLATNCGTSAGQGCTVQVQYSTGGGAVSTVGASVTGAVATFTGTFTASNWPVNFSFSPSGCTGGTNYTGKLFYVVSSTSTTITTSSTGFTNGGTGAVASGTATGCTLTAQHVLTLFDKTGTLLGVSFAAASGSADYPQYYFIGNANAGNIPTNGKISKWDSLVADLTGAQILP